MLVAQTLYTKTWSTWKYGPWLIYLFMAGVNSSAEHICIKWTNEWIDESMNEVYNIRLDTR